MGELCRSAGNDVKVRFHEFRVFYRVKLLGEKRLTVKQSLELAAFSFA